MRKKVKNNIRVESLLSGNLSGSINGVVFQKNGRIRVNKYSMLKKVRRQSKK